MKDSKNKLKKSSSESQILENKTAPPIPKDKRTKQYKEWYKKYGEIDKKESKSSSKESKSKKEDSKINKKIKLSIWDKASIFFNFYIRKVHQK